MNNTLDSTVLSIAEDNQSDSTQYITFNLGEYLLALPSREILKVVSMPPPNEGGLVSMGMVQLGPYSIQIIDLKTLLVLNSNALKRQAQTSVSSTMSVENRKAADTPTENEHPPFLVVMQNAEKALWGIALHTAPDLIQVPNYALKPVPFAKRQTQSLKWISHLASYDLGGTRHSLLILDLSAILDPNSATLREPEMSTFTEIKPPLRPPSKPIALPLR